MKIGWSGRIGIGVLLVFAALGIVGVQSIQTPPSQLYSVSGEAEQTLAPYLRVEKEQMEYGFYTSQGDWVSSEANQGKIVLLYFWATWCQPCRPMIPKLNILRQKYQTSNLVITLVALDEEPERIQTFIQNKKVTVPYTFLPKDVITDSELIAGVPTMFLLSKTSEILKRTEGIISLEQVEIDVLGYLKK